MTEDRKRARELAAKHVETGDPLGWFEPLYAEASGDAEAIPWADQVPTPALVEWLDREPSPVNEGRALIIGCGLGDDAEEISRRGFRVTAFDIAPSAIEWCEERFPNSKVEYATIDLFATPGDWRGSFDFVEECYTLQVLPPDLRRLAVSRIASFLSPGGVVLVLARGRDATDPAGSMPWPLTREDLEGFTAEGLSEVSFEDYVDQENPPVRRFRAVYQRTSAR